MNRYKRVFVLLCVISFAAGLTGCSFGKAVGAEGNQNTARKGGQEEAGEKQVPEIGRIREICELSVLECYYHNVAKSVKEPGTGVVHFGEKERPFWIEYTGTAEISFRADLIKMEQDGTEITITLPEPEVTCRADPDSWNEDSYVITKDRPIQKNPITAEDQTRAIDEAQADMLERVKNDQEILRDAKAQIQRLIENYIDKIGRETGTEYQISWKEESTGSAEKRPLEGEMSEKGMEEE